MKKLSREKILSETVINQVVKHQFDSAHQALKDNNTIEISGFGKFAFNVKKAEKRLEKFKKFKATYERDIAKGKYKEEKHKNWIKNKISTLTLNINSLSSKLNNDEKE